MGILNWLGVGADLAKPIDAASNLYTTDKARLEAEKDLELAAQKPELAQLANNAIMAASSSMFNSGWQPLVGWVAGFLVLLYYLPQLIIIECVWGYHCISTVSISPFPMAPDNILNLVYLLFGFGVHSLARKLIVRP